MLNLTKTESRALLVLGVALLISVVVQGLRPHRSDSRLFNYSLQDSLFKKYAADTLRALQIKEKTPPPEKPDVKIKPQKKTLALKSVNINTAGKSELERLPRIGPSTAKKIIALRREMSGFKKIDDLLKVKGIGPKTLDKIRPYLFLKEKGNAAK